jgi:hypothetical protein
MALIQINDKLNSCVSGDETVGAARVAKSFKVAAGALPAGIGTVLTSKRKWLREKADDEQIRQNPFELSRVVPLAKSGRVSCPQGCRLCPGCDFAVHLRLVCHSFRPLGPL